MGLFIGEYVFAAGAVPSLDAILELPATLKPTSKGWYVEYDQFPPSSFLLSHLDATFRELGGAGERDGDRAAPVPAPPRAWQLLPWWEKLIYHSALIRFLALLVGPLLRRFFAKRKAE